MGFRLWASGLPLLFMVAAGPASADPAITRITMLPVPGRTTILVELDGPVANVEQVQAGSDVVVEGGPVAPGVRERKLVPAVTSPLISGVSVSGFVRRDGVQYFRLHITLHTPAIHRLRAAGSRIYVDLSPPEAAAAPRQAIERARDTPAASVDSIDTPPRHPAAPEPSMAQLQDDPSRPHEPAKQPPLTPAARQVDAAAAYRELESSTLRRARELTSRPDVKGLLRLREAVQKRDAELGKQQTDLVTRLLDQLNRFVDEARALQLARDQGQFLKHD